MAVMQGVLYRPVVGGTYPKLKRYDIVCIHTIVGYDEGGSAAHFTTNFDGFITQWRDTIFQSAANYDGNYRIIAIENEDHGPAYGKWNTSDGHAVPAFTAKQCEAIAQILVWCYRTHGIPLVLCPNSRSTSRGIAYHRQGIQGNFASYDFGGVVPGGEIWTKWNGKVCPGDRRIHQLIDIIIPRARVLAGLDKPPTPPIPPVEDDMFSDADRNLLTQTFSLSVETLVQLRAQNKSLAEEVKRISRNVDSILGLQSVEEIKQELLKIKRDILLTISEADNQALWEEMETKTWDQLSLHTWSKLPA